MCGIARRVVERFGIRRPTANDERQRALRDRRSATRPIFQEGWRRRLGSVGRAVVTSAEPATNRIDIWLASTDGIFRAKSCLQLLSEREQAALFQIRDLANRHSSMAARVLLRLGLSKAAGPRISPAQWEFSEAQQERPRVRAGLPQIRYSVSHVDELVMVAISSTVDVGLDVESVDHEISDSMLSEFCHSDEQRSIRPLSVSRQSREFLRMWTLKEAYTKMRGVGHGIDFSSLDFLPGRSGSATPRVERDGTAVGFENFYVSMGHDLLHASLAYQARGAAVGDTEISITSLVDPAGHPVHLNPAMS